MNNVLSIIIPYYDSGNVLGRMLDSLKKMIPVPSFSFEVLIVDDGSKEEVPVRLLQGLPFQCTVYRKENGGPLSARCFGIEHAKGEYIYFADADDALRETFFADFCEALRRGGFDVCLVDFYDKAGEKFLETSYPSKIDDAYYVRNLAGTAKLGYAITHIFKKSLFTPEVKKKAACIDIRYSEDLYFWILLFAPNRTYCHLSNPAYIYIPNMASASSQFNLGAIKDISRVMGVRYAFIKNAGSHVSYSEKEFFQDVVNQIAYVRMCIFRHTPKSEKKPALDALLAVPFLGSLLMQKYAGLSFSERAALWKLKREYRCKKRGVR